MLEPRDDLEDGQIYLGAMGDDFVEALSRLLTTVIHFVGGLDEVAGNGRLLSVRAEAPTRELLVARLIDAVVDALDQESSIAGAYTDGIVRTDDGFVAWARIELGPGPARPHLDFTLEATPEIDERPEETLIGLIIRTLD
jgi:hypothetical protein